MKATMSAAVFNRMIGATRGFVEKESHPMRRAYQYIKMDFSAADSSVTAVAVDGYRMSVEKGNCLTVDEDFTIYIKPNARFQRKNILEIETDSKTATIRCGDVVFGYVQPQNPGFLDWEKVLPKGDPVFRIGFNADYLLSALQAAKASAGNVIRTPVVLEFRGPRDPALLQTGDNTGIKMIMPVRIKE